MKNTKEKIIDISLELFNKQGWKNSTMRDIAQLSELSVGNLTYHFRNRESLLIALYEQMSEEMKQMMQLKTYHLDAIQEVLNFFKLCRNKYKFIFIDIVEITRAVPELGKRHQALIAERQMEIRFLLDAFIHSDILDNDINEEDYNVLAKTLVMVHLFWMSYNYSSPFEDTHDETFVTWTLLKPYLTKKGLKEWKKRKKIYLSINQSI